MFLTPCHCGRKVTKISCLILCACTSTKIEPWMKCLGLLISVHMLSVGANKLHFLCAGGLWSTISVQNSSNHSWSGYRLDHQRMTSNGNRAGKPTDERFPHVKAFCLSAAALHESLVVSPCRLSQSLWVHSSTWWAELTAVASLFVVFDLLHTEVVCLRDVPECPMKSLYVLNSDRQQMTDAAACKWHQCRAHSLNVSCFQNCFTRNIHASLDRRLLRFIHQFKILSTFMMDSFKKDSFYLQEYFRSKSQVSIWNADSSEKLKYYFRTCGTETLPDGITQRRGGRCDGLVGLIYRVWSRATWPVSLFERPTVKPLVSFRGHGSTETTPSAWTIPIIV